MVYETEVNISLEENKFFQDVLDCKNEVSKKDTIIKTYYVKFDNGFEVDIKVVDSYTPYVDPVLFDELGFEVLAMEVRDTLCGVYKFSFANDDYIVRLNAVEYNMIPFWRLALCF